MYTEKCKRFSVHFYIAYGWLIFLGLLVDLSFEFASVEMELGLETSLR